MWTILCLNYTDLKFLLWKVKTVEKSKINEKWSSMVDNNIKLVNNLTNLVKPAKSVIGATDDITDDNENSDIPVHFIKALSKT